MMEDLPCPNRKTLQVFFFSDLVHGLQCPVEVKEEIPK
jgi:hypothetical protein